MRNLREKLQMLPPQLRIFPEQETLLHNLETILTTVSTLIEESQLKMKIQSSLELVTLLTDSLKLLKLPAVKPIGVDLVDSGPGQFPNQKDVAFCNKLLFHVLDTNNYFRVRQAIQNIFLFSQDIRILFSLAKS